MLMVCEAVRKAEKLHYLYHGHVLSTREESHEIQQGLYAA